MNRSFFFAAILLSTVTACTQTVPQIRGANLYIKYCTSCHGASALGDGPQAAELPIHPANLTLLRDRNGGVFPTEDVIAQVYGYTGRHQFGGMPEFGREIEGPTVDWVAKSGEVIPTPRALIELAEYLESIQQ